MGREAIAHSTFAPFLPTAGRERPEGAMPHLPTGDEEQRAEEEHDAKAVEFAIQAERYGPHFKQDAQPHGEATRHAMWPHTASLRCHAAVLPIGAIVCPATAAVSAVACCRRPFYHPTTQRYARHVGWIASRSPTTSARSEESPLRPTFVPPATAAACVC